MALPLVETVLVHDALKPGRALCADLSSWEHGAQTRNMQNTRHQSRRWGHFKRAEYGAVVTIANAKPAMSPNGSREPEGPKSSGRAAITNAADWGFSPTYERNRSPNSAEDAPSCVKDAPRTTPRRTPSNSHFLGPPPPTGDDNQAPDHARWG